MAALTAVLIADDLTGSLDSIAPFARLGMDCVTAVSPDGLAAALALSPDVLAVSLGTRELPPEDARGRVVAVTRALMEAAGPRTVWVKKIDSRLKGPIAAEIAGMSEIMHPDRVLLCPAIPELGRFVSRGQLRGEGISGVLPVADTVGLSQPCDVPDAESDADLDRIVDRLRPGTLVAAARGLAAALARRLAPDGPAALAGLPRGPIGLAIGSRDPITLTQLAELRLHGGPRFIEAPDGNVEPVAAAGPFVIQATAGAGAPGPVVAARLAGAVAASVGGLTSLVLSGGETAAAVLAAAGIRVLRVEGEVLPGLPLCHAADREDFPAIVTKSGGFGAPDTLLRLWRAAQVLEGCH